MLFEVSDSDLEAFYQNSSPLKQFALLDKPDKFLLHRIAQLLPDNSIVVELGTYLGGAISIIAHANKSVEIHGFDLFDDGIYSNNQLTLFEKALGKENSRTLDNVKKFLEFYQNIHLYEVKKNEPINFTKKIDLFIEDASHRDPQLSLSLSHWLPKIKINGFLLIHDYRPWKDINAKGRFPDVEKQVEILRKSESWNFLGSLNSNKFDIPGSYAVFQKVK